MGFAFGDGAADALIRAANSADEVLRAEGGFLHGAVEQAVQDFDGGYGRLFKDACGIRSDDRGRLAGVLAALAKDVGEAKHRAQQEKARQKNMDAWQQRDNIRKQQCSPVTSRKHPRHSPTKTPAPCRRVLPAAAVLLLTLAGCGTTPSTNPPTSTVEQTMGPEQARKEYLDIFTQIQALAPGDWTKVAPEAPGDVCDLPQGIEGTQFSFDSTRSVISEDEAEARHKTAKEVLECKGLRVVQTQPSGANRDQTTTGFGDGKFSMQLGTSSLGTTLGGNTRCAPDPQGKFR